MQPGLSLYGPPVSTEVIRQQLKLFQAPKPMGLHGILDSLDPEYEQSWIWTPTVGLLREESDSAFVHAVTSRFNFPSEIV